MATILPTAFPAQLSPLAEEVRTFFRELPRLLDEGGHGRFALVKADTIHGVWDTQRDAILFGRERFPEGGFLAQPIDYRFQQLLGDPFATETTSSGAA